MKKEFTVSQVQVIVLLLLKRHTELFSFQFLSYKSIQGNRLVFDSDSLFKALYKLEGAGVIESTKLRIGKRTRKHYHLAPSISNDEGLLKTITSVLNQHKL